MKRLHDILSELINVAADIENLSIVLKEIEQLSDGTEKELRATVNIAIRSLASIKTDIENDADLLDGFLLEQGHIETSITVN